MRIGKIAVRNIRRNTKRSILSVISTGIATFAIVFLFSYIEGLVNDMEDMAFNYDTGQILIRHKDFDEKVISLNRAVDNYSKVVELINSNYPNLLVSPRLSFPSTVLKGDRDYLCFGVAVDFNSEKKYLELNEKLISGDFPVNSREALVGIGLAEELNIGIGDKFTPITLTRRGASSGITFKVTGLGKFTNGSFTNKTFITHIDGISKMLRMPGAASQILIKGIEDSELNSYVDSINNLFKNKGLRDIYAYSWKDIGLGFTMIRLADISYTVMAFFFFILASSVIANTMLMVVFERRREIGTITAMGMSGKEVVLLFFYEALILGAIGAFTGVILGIALVVPLSYIGIDLSSMAENVDMGTSFIIYPDLTFKSTILVFFYSVVVASVVSFFPSKTAVKVDPVVALRSE